MDALRDTLMAKTHFGFDLDDTLHEYRKAAGAASGRVFLKISRTYAPRHTITVTCDELKSSYSGILAKYTAKAFDDGRTSDEYRKERFGALMLEYAIPHTDGDLSDLAATYENCLWQNLQLKEGAHQLLRQLRDQDKVVLIITEGPTDAQRWTLYELGLASDVNDIITSNQMGMSKTEGLFAAVLEKYQIEAKDMVYIGDSMKRDVIPASEVGILPILYDEQNECDLEATKGFISINSHAMIGRLMAGLESDEEWIEDGEAWIEDGEARASKDEAWPDEAEAWFEKYETWSDRGENWSGEAREWCGKNHAWACPGGLDISGWPDRDSETEIMRSICM